MKHAAKIYAFLGFLIPGGVRAFPTAEAAKAHEWIVENQVGDRAIRGSASAAQAVLRARASRWRKNRGGRAEAEALNIVTGLVEAGS
jgi:hypothetical protein